MEHELKTLPIYFQDVVNGSKRFELRKNDRNFKEGDNVLLREFNGQDYTGREIKASIIYVLTNCPNYGLQEGFCILGIMPLAKSFQYIDKKTGIEYR